MAEVGVTCRAISPDDLDDVARIWLDGWLSNGITLAEESTYPALRARIEREIAPDGWQVIVADSAGSVVGFVAISPAAAVLEQIFVAPDCHRQGIGTALLAAARQAMPSGFTLWTHGDNVRAADFYKDMGMTLLGPGIHPKQGHPILTFAFGPVSP
jgi:GNAT superfamily N-acetyltransferase